MDIYNRGIEQEMRSFQRECMIMYTMNNDLAGTHSYSNKADAIKWKCTK